MSLDDRLTFGEGPLGDLPEAEPEPEEGGKPNRAFIFIAAAMGGLILLGVLALVAALVFWVPQQKRQQVARVTQTIDALTSEAAAWTPTFTPSPTIVAATSTPTVPPTWTPIPTATPTRVVSEDDTKAEPTAVPTNTPVSNDWGTTTTPPTGLGAFGVAAIGVGLVGLMFASRKLRSGT